MSNNYKLIIFFKTSILFVTGELPGARASGHHTERHQARSRPALPSLSHGDKVRGGREETLQRPCGETLQV